MSDRAAAAAAAATTPSTRPAPRTKPIEPRHLDIALHHANILQERKRVEADVLQAVMMLMDWPTSPNADPKNPSVSDARSFCQAILSFQPVDYDALVEERNLSDKCGYALCPRSKQRARSTAKKQFVDTDRGVEIVPREVLEMWCSDDCARRALYIKVQLSEEPAWMRHGQYADKIELMVDEPKKYHEAPPLGLETDATAMAADLGDDGGETAAAWAACEDARACLAFERGEKVGHSAVANKHLIKAEIQEKFLSNGPPQPPLLPSRSSENLTMIIEGHHPKLNRKEEDDGEDDVQDWDKHLM